MTNSKTVIKGIAKSRKGSPSISIQKILGRAPSELNLKLSEAGVSNEEALEAAEFLSKKRSPFRHLEGGAIAGAVSPALQALGRGTQAAIDAKERPGRAAWKAVKNTSKGEVARQALHSTLFGTTLSAGREGLQAQRAKDTVKDFLGQNKKAGIESVLDLLRSHSRKADTALDLVDDAARHADNLARPLRTGGSARAGGNAAIDERDRRNKEAAEALLDLVKTAFSTSMSSSSAPSAGASQTATSARAANRVGQFKGFATPKTMSPPGPALPKRLSTGARAINPRRSITSAINAFR